MVQSDLLPPLGQPLGQVQPFWPGGGELFEAVMSRTFWGRGRGKLKITSPALFL